MYPEIPGRSPGGLGDQPRAEGTPETVGPVCCASTARLRIRPASDVSRRRRRIRGAIIAAGWYRIEDGILDARRRRSRPPSAAAISLPATASVPPPVAGRPADDDLRRRRRSPLPRRFGSLRSRSQRAPVLRRQRPDLLGEWVASLALTACPHRRGIGAPDASRSRSTARRSCRSTFRGDAAACAGARSTPRRPRITFLLADAERLPLRDERSTSLPVMAPCITCDAAAVVREAAGCCTGGSWLATIRTGRRSASRSVDDAADDLRNWTQATRYLRKTPRVVPRRGLTSEIKLHFFLPPHPVMMMSPAAAERWLRVTDRAFHAVGLRSLAGIIVVSATKSQAVPA